MKCPACKDVDLAMTTRQNVEIDYCPKCRGIWLDRGELDKIIAQSERYDDDDDDRRRHAPPPPHGYAPSRGYPSPHQHQPYSKKRKPWWTEIFD